MIKNLCLDQLKLICRQWTEVSIVFIFFLLICLLFPFALGANSLLLKTIAPGFILIAITLSSLLGIENLFQRDYDDGTLIYYVISPYSLSVLASIKIFTHWFITQLPLVLMTPFVANMFSMARYPTEVLWLSVAISSLILSFLGGFSSAITLNARKSPVTITLLILPLYIPILIFAAGAVSYAQSGLPISGLFAILVAILISVLLTMPFVIAGALRASIKV